ncbi:MAG: hypothetical protein WAM60_15970 [Candidatus Promineifilaceae bacterium]
MMSPGTKKYALDTPIIFEDRPKKKRSPSTRDARKIERHLSRAAHRAVRAADKGMQAYRKASRKSASRQRDGALVDFVPNVLKGSAVTMRQLSLVPYELWRAANTPQARKATRRSVRYMARIADDILDE